MHELGGLKKNILGSMQENFYELCQALAEALIEREFKVNPEEFAKVVQRAINDAVEGDQYKVAVHPEFKSKLDALGLKELEGRIVIDEGLEVGGFRIDTDVGAVDGNIKQIVSDLIEQAETDLFDQAVVDKKDQAS